MENNTKGNPNTEGKSKRPGLIRQERVVPNIPERTEINKHKEENNPITNEKSADGKAIIKVYANQQCNIKISKKTKKQLDMLIKFTSHKFVYELVDNMIDVYIDNALDHDQRRAFKTLSKMISD